MTWLQLFEQIRSMNDEERLQTVRFVESHDEGGVIEATFGRAECDVWRGDDKCRPIIYKGEPHLWKP